MYISKSPWKKTIALILAAAIGLLTTILDTSAADAPPKPPTDNSAKPDAAASAKVDQGLALLKRNDPESFRKAYRLFEDAANANDPDAEFNLGVLNMNGQGVPKSDKAAAVWFRETLKKVQTL